MRGEITGVPALAQGRGVRALGLQQVGEEKSFTLGMGRHASKPTTAPGARPVDIGVQGAHGPACGQLAGASHGRGTMVGMTSTPPPSSPNGLDPEIAARLKRSADGLVPAIAQQYDTGEVLMLGWMDDEALHRTLTTGRCTYWSRSRREYWVKGDTSGHFQWVKSVALDCDADTILVQVDQVGAACHTGARTCFDEDVLLKEATPVDTQGADSGVPSLDQ
ncbi:hypothetical protein GCM10010317_035610 [Streptomyces mirabilis]|nr:hypothetical protein GCM10010317_035610 [Streptomyces mirabilis]